MLCQRVQEVTGGIVKLAWAKKGFALLPRRCVVEFNFAWLARFKRLSRCFERMLRTLSGLYFVVFAMLMLPKAALFLASNRNSQYALMHHAVQAVKQPLMGRLQPFMGSIQGLKCGINRRVVGRWRAQQNLVSRA